MKDLRVIELSVLRWLGDGWSKHAANTVLEHPDEFVEPRDYVDVRVEVEHGRAWVSIEQQLEGERLNDACELCRVERAVTLSGSGNPISPTDRTVNGNAATSMPSPPSMSTT